MRKPREVLSWILSYLSNFFPLSAHCPNQAITLLPAQQSTAAICFKSPGEPPLPLTCPSDCTSLSYSELPSSWLLPSDMPCYLACGHSKARFSSPGLRNLSSTQFQPEPAGICSRSQLQTTPVKKIAGAEGRAHRSYIASQRLTSQAGRKSAGPGSPRTSGDHRYWASPTL